MDKTWLNKKSFIPLEDLETGPYKYILDKICLILFSKEYASDTMSFARNILDFLVAHEFLTWKQATAILHSKTTAERAQLYKSYSKTTYGKTGMPDREHDLFTKQIFGDNTRAEEFGGYTKAYRSDGSRYFSLPTGEEKLSDYI
jgi:hypothetical protein